jgi:putative transposase
MAHPSGLKFTNNAPPGRRPHEEFRRRVKTQGSLPNEDAALTLLFSLVASGQIKLRRIDGWRKIGTVLRPSPVAA